MLNSLLWFFAGFVLCFIVHLWVKGKVLKQLNKVVDNKKLNNLWVGGVKYAISQIERTW